MKILVLTQYFWPETFKINDLVSDFVARGHEVTVLTGYPSYPDRNFPHFDRTSASASNYCGARVVRVPLLPRGKGIRLILNYLSFALSASVLGTWRVRGLAFDVIFVYEPSPITIGIPAVLLKRLRGIPIVFWVQDLWPETLQALGVVRSPRALALVGRLVRFIYDRCDIILAQSQSFIPHIAARCSVPKRIEYFPNWGEPADETLAEPAPEVPPDAGKFSILFAGNMGESQDFPTILSAAERLRHRDDIRWIIVGDGRMFEWVKSEVEQRNLTGRVLLMGRFPPDRMPSFFRHADALLVSLKPDPVLSTTIPSKLQTYLAAGLPILAMIDGEGASVMSASQAGLVCAAGSPGFLASAAETLADMPLEDRMEMGKRGRRYAHEHFDRRKQLDKLENMLIEELGKAS